MLLQLQRTVVLFGDNTKQLPLMSFFDELLPGLASKCWQVYKFGGTSVADANSLEQVAQIIEDQLDINNDVLGPDTKHLAVVVSAMGGKPKVTDLLLGAVRHASLREHYKVEEQLDIVLEKHSECLKILFRQEYAEQERLVNIIKGGLNDIRDILKTVSLMKWQAERISGEFIHIMIPWIEYQASRTVTNICCVCLSP